MTVIRAATAADRDAIRAVTLAAYAQYEASLSPPFWEAYRRNILSTLAEAAPAEQIVAEDAGAVLGTVLLYPPHAALYTREGPPPSAWPEVRLLAVSPDGRGRGIGEALMRECAVRARRAGAARLALHTTPMMAAALRLYTRMGFERVPELDFSPAPGFRVHGYALDLPQG